MRYSSSTKGKRRWRMTAMQRGGNGRQSGVARRVLLLGALLACGISAGALFAREDQGSAKVEAQPLLKHDLAGEPGKEVDIHIYTFPPGVSVPWHIHPGAHEFDYELEGTLTLEIAGEGKRALKAGEAAYVPPNAVHRGLNESATE